jgi:hypothetical protein
MSKQLVRINITLTSSVSVRVPDVCSLYTAFKTLFKRRGLFSDVSVYFVLLIFALIVQCLRLSCHLSL